LGGAQRFQGEVVDDEEVHGGERGELAIVRAGGAGSLELAEELRLRREEHVIAFADGRVPEGLGEVALAGTARAGDEDRDLLLEKAAGGEVEDESLVEAGIESEVEVLERLLPSEARPSQPQGELLVLAPSHLVGDEQTQELGVGELLLDGLAVADLERVEDPGEAQLLEHRGEVGHRVHRDLLREGGRDRGVSPVEGQWKRSNCRVSRQKRPVPV
jgi:hypothetical protein